MKGNCCVFFLFSIINGFLFVLGVGIFAISIYLFALTGHMNMFNGSFILISIAICTLAVWSMYMKKSPYTLCIYLFIVFSLFALQMILTMALLIERETVINWAMENSDNETQESIEEIRELMERHIKTTSYVLLGTCMLTLGVFILGWWYRTTMIISMINNKYKKLSSEKESEYEIEMG